MFFDTWHGLLRVVVVGPLAYLALVLFLGATTSVPARPLPYLEHMYGYIGRDAVRDPVTGYFRPRS